MVGKHQTRAEKHYQQTDGDANHGTDLLHQEESIISALLRRTNLIVSIFFM